MLDHITPLARLREVLANNGFDSDAQIEDGAQGVASPSRLATEWSGFRVASGGNFYYAKVLCADMVGLIDVERSALASGCAGEAGAAPRLICADVANGVLIFAALPAADWRVARLDDLQSPDRIEALWDLKRAVHAGPTPGFIRSPLDDIHTLRQLCQRDEVALPAEAAWIDDCVDLAWNALQSRAFDAVPVHGDGVASNVMISAGGQLQLVDFDYGGAMDPWYDIAMTLNELYPFEEQWRAGIAAWAGHCSEQDYAVCRLYALINDWYWTLWAFWTGTVSSRPLEFFKLGQWTLLRCRLTTQDPRLESWLRQVEGVHP